MLDSIGVNNNEINLVRGFGKQSYNYVLKHIQGYCRYYIFLVKVEPIESVELDEIVFVRGRINLDYQNIQKLH